jgi:deazaflavin-dependent oxidoreductase (nitroreductase family)
MAGKKTAVKKSTAKKSTAKKSTAKPSANSTSAKSSAPVGRTGAKAAASNPTPAPRTASKPAPAAKPAPKAAPRLPGWMADHLARYLATNGADGHMWRGYPTLLLTTIGRQSNEERLLPLIYGRDGDRYVVVASRGGAPDHPSWYKNLVENPEVKVQVKGDRFRARARTANRDERPRLWRTMTKLFPFYDQYQSKTAREIPVILIERFRT